MSLGWNTYVLQKNSCVVYGQSPDALKSRVCTNYSSTYNTSRTYSQSVVMSNLKPSTEYYYKIVSTNSSIESFLSPRSAGDQGSFSFDVVADLGVYGENGFTVNSNGALDSEKNKDMKKKRDANVEPLTIEASLNHTTISRLADNFDRSEFVLHPGDFAYADDWRLKSAYHRNMRQGIEAYQLILEQFYGQLAPISSRKAYMAGPGNHEASCSSDRKEVNQCPEGQNNFTDFLHRFDRTMPTAFPSRSRNHTAQDKASMASELANPPFWYSFEYGYAHLLFPSSWMLYLLYTYIGWHM